ncbi:hypothetical protein [Deinococcus maricopensis]|uniref:Uncharacterized protein n=1 Tax=Deinococcus maricopensis (strain DSM 21211 / LMG 22137 / NRRL B-23946 / LB-34) TaxID=709986 RepID=E8U7P1_DEIML|nr:hypothetical protein [Deinococcus maricopensis]ADV67080.1 hypothetical protein Deima_1431 [Deinococcus maricopensis DSM 21211]
MNSEPTGSSTVKGTRGFELDAHLAFTGTLTPEQARHALRGWTGRIDLYGGETVRSARVTGPLDADATRALLRAGLEGGTLRYAEVGLRGFLRSADGVTDWVPWRRNVVLARTDVDGVQFESGVRYVLE